MVSFGIAAVYGAKPTCGVPRSDGVLGTRLSSLGDDELQVRQPKHAAEYFAQHRHGLVDGRELVEGEVFI